LSDRFIVFFFFQHCLGKCTVRGSRLSNVWKGGSLGAGLNLVARRRKSFLFLSSVEIEPPSPYTTMLLFEVICLMFCCEGKGILTPVRLVCRANKNRVILLTVHTPTGILESCYIPVSSHHHHHVQKGLGLIPVPCILKMKLVPPSLPRSSYVSSSFWFIL